MKKYILSFIFIFNIAAFANFYAVGGNIGTNKGLNFLAYTNEKEAIQVNTSFDINSETNKLTFTLDRLFFSYINKDSSIYYGVGLKFSDKEDQNFGVRGVLGVAAYLVNIDENLEIFGDVDPTVHLNPSRDFIDFEFGLGLRYYF